MRYNRARSSLNPVAKFLWSTDFIVLPPHFGIWEYTQMVLIIGAILAAFVFDRIRSGAPSDLNGEAE